MKKFETLGRSLSKEQQKKIVGGGGTICISCGNNHTLCTYCANGGIGTNYQGIDCTGGGSANCQQQ